MTRIILLGTGTGVGKTYVGRTLAASLRASGHTVLALKPIESGIPAPSTLAATLPSATPAPTDASELGHAAGFDAGHCYALPEPISPHLAARRAGLTLDLERVSRWVEEQERRFKAHTGAAADYTLIESAGGAFSPVTDHQTNHDLALAVSRPDSRWILVAPDSLGVLHDVSAALLAQKSLGRVADHVVLCGARHADASTGTNATELMALGICRVDSVLERDARPSPERATFLTHH